MSGSLNKVMLIGNTGDDVKIHYFEGGNSIGRFPLATNETYTNKTTNERVTTTEWHNIVVRNKAAEICEKYLKKGDMIYIEGQIRTRKWQDQQGIERYTTEIHCTDFQFLSSKGDGSSKTPECNDRVKPESSKRQTSQNEVSDIKDDENKDLPF